MKPKRPPNKNTPAKRAYNAEYGAKTTKQRAQRNAARRISQDAKRP